MSGSSYYELLGVSSTASEREITTAYRRLAVKLHPDKNQGDAEANKNFQELAEAYSVLHDPEARARYDYKLANPHAFDYDEYGVDADEARHAQFQAFFDAMTAEFGFQAFFGGGMGGHTGGPVCTNCGNPDCPAANGYYDSDYSDEFDAFWDRYPASRGYGGADWGSARSYQTKENFIYGGGTKPDQLPKPKVTHLKLKKVIQVKYQLKTPRKVVEAYNVQVKSLPGDDRWYDIYSGPNTSVELQLNPHEPETKTYHFRVQALNHAGSGEWSQAAQVQVQGTGRMPPKNDPQTAESKAEKEAQKKAARKARQAEKRAAEKAAMEEADKAERERHLNSMKNARSDLEAALKSENISLTQMKKVVRACEKLGVELDKSMSKRVHSKLDKLDKLTKGRRQVEEATSALTTAIEEEDLPALREALAAGRALKVDADTIAKGAEKLHSLEAKDKVRNELETAQEVKDINRLRLAIEASKVAGVSVAKAKKVLRHLEKEEALRAQLQAALDSRDRKQLGDAIDAAKATKYDFSGVIDACERLYDMLPDPSAQPVPQQKSKGKDKKSKKESKKQQQRGAPSQQQQQQPREGASMQQKGRAPQQPPQQQQQPPPQQHQQFHPAQQQQQQQQQRQPMPAGGAPPQGQQHPHSQGQQQGRRAPHPGQQQAPPQQQGQMRPPQPPPGQHPHGAQPQDQPPQQQQQFRGHDASPFPPPGQQQQPPQPQPQQQQQHSPPPFPYGPSDMGNRGGHPGQQQLQQQAQPWSGFPSEQQRSQEHPHGQQQQQHTVAAFQPQQQNSLSHPPSDQGHQGPPPNPYGNNSSPFPPSRAPEQPPGDATAQGDAPDSSDFAAGFAAGFASFGSTPSVPPAQSGMGRGFSNYKSFETQPRRSGTTGSRFAFTSSEPNEDSSRRVPGDNPVRGGSGSGSRRNTGHSDHSHDNNPYTANPSTSTGSTGGNPYSAPKPYDPFGSSGTSHEMPSYGGYHNSPDLAPASGYEEPYPASMGGMDSGLYSHSQTGTQPPQQQGQSPEYGIPNDPYATGSSDGYNPAMYPGGPGGAQAGGASLQRRSPLGFDAHGSAPYGNGVGGNQPPAVESYLRQQRMQQRQGRRRQREFKLSDEAFPALGDEEAAAAAAARKSTEPDSSDDDDEYPPEMQAPICKYWPNCAMGPRCRFTHPDYPEFGGEEDVYREVVAQDMDEFEQGAGAGYEQGAGAYGQGAGFDGASYQTSAAPAGYNPFGENHTDTTYSPEGAGDDTDQVGEQETVQAAPAQPVRSGLSKPWRSSATAKPPPPAPAQHGGYTQRRSGDDGYVQPCKFWAKHGHCRYGNRCHYAHDEDQGYIPS